MDIVHRVGIKASLESVYSALTTSSGLTGWFARAEGRGELGSVIKFRFSHADGREIGGAEMKILELQPSERVLWQTIEGPPEWGGTKVRFALKQDGEYCVLLFSHVDWKETTEFMHHCSTKWAAFLLSLKALLETGKGMPNPGDIEISNWH